MRRIIYKSSIDAGVRLTHDGSSDEFVFDFTYDLPTGIINN